MQSCLICDDHALMRDALSAAVGGRWPEAEIRQAGNFGEAWTIAESAPDLCLVDLMMPGAGPVEGVRGLLSAAPDSRVIVVTGSHDDALLVELLKSGVDGFLQKTATSDVILAAIELVLAGGRYLPPRVAELAVAQSQHAAAPASSQLSFATDRQRAVLRLVAQGLSNKEIARELGISPATVKTHVGNAIASVGAANRTEAAIRAREAGVI